jgi:hypothetical protein
LKGIDRRVCHPERAKPGALWARRTWPMRIGTSNSNAEYSEMTVENAGRKKKTVQFGANGAFGVRIARP